MDKLPLAHTMETRVVKFPESQNHAILMESKASLTGVPASKGLDWKWTEIPSHGLTSVTKALSFLADPAYPPTSTAPPFHLAFNPNAPTIPIENSGSSPSPSMAEGGSGGGGSIDSGQYSFQMSSPTSTLLHERGSISIFWDLENCPPPSGMPGFIAVDNLRKTILKLCPSSPITAMKAYAEIDRVNQKLRSELQSSGVSLTDAPHNNKKDAADKMILVDLLAFAIDTPPPATVVLISGDRDFVYALSILRNRRYNVILIVPNRGASIILRAQATVCLEWRYDVLKCEITYASPPPPLGAAMGRSGFGIYGSSPDLPHVMQELSVSSNKETVWKEMGSVTLLAGDVPPNPTVSGGGGGTVNAIQHSLVKSALDGGNKCEGATKQQPTLPNARVALLLQSKRACQSADNLTSVLGNGLNQTEIVPGIPTVQSDPSKSKDRARAQGVLTSPLIIPTHHQRRDGPLEAGENEPNPSQEEEEDEHLLHSPSTPGYFDALVEVLWAHRAAGVTHPLASKVAQELLNRNPLLLQRAGLGSTSVSTTSTPGSMLDEAGMEAYFKLAMGQGIVSLNKNRAGQRVISMRTGDKGIRMRGGGGVSL